MNYHYLLSNFNIIPFILILLFHLTSYSPYIIMDYHHIPSNFTTASFLLSIIFHILYDPPYFKYIHYHFHALIPKINISGNAECQTLLSCTMTLSGYFTHTFVFILESIKCALILFLFLRKNSSEKYIEMKIDLINQTLI